MTEPDVDPVQRRADALDDGLSKGAIIHIPGRWSLHAHAIHGPITRVACRRPWRSFADFAAQGPLASERIHTEDFRAIQCRFIWGNTRYEFWLYAVDESDVAVRRSWDHAESWLIEAMNRAQSQPPRRRWWAADGDDDIDAEEGAPARAHASW